MKKNILAVLLILIVTNLRAVKFLIGDLPLDSSELLEKPAGFSENSLFKKEPGLLLIDSVPRQPDLKAGKESPVMAGKHSKKKLADLGLSAHGYSQLDLDEHRKQKMIVTFRHLKKKQRKRLCKELPLRANDIFLSHFLDDAYKHEQTADLVQTLCRQKGAGFEIKVHMFPCMTRATGHLAQIQDYVVKGASLQIKNCLAHDSFLRLNFRYQPDSPYDLGFSTSSSCYTREDWQTLKAIFVKKYNKDSNEIVDQPNLKYEFRTLGKCDREAFMSAQQEFANWYNPLVARYQQELAVKSFDNDLYYFEHQIKETGETIPVCVAKKNWSARFSKSDIIYQLQTTLAFDIVDLSKVIKVVVQDRVIGVKNRFTDMIPSFLTFTYAASNMLQAGDDRCHLSGMEYLSTFDWLETQGPQPLHYDYVSQVNLLRFYGALWFKQMGNKQIAAACAGINSRSGKKYLKAYTFVLPRSSEFDTFDPSVIEHVLTSITPFFDIYLPFEVMPLADSSGLSHLEHLLFEYEQILTRWKAKSDPAAADQITKGEEYINYVRTTMFHKDDFDPANYSFDPQRRVRVNTETYFRLSFSLYLLDIIVNGKKDVLVLNHYYRVRDMKGKLRSPLGTTPVSESLKTTVVFEYISTPLKANFFDKPLNPLITDFFEGH